MSHELKEGVELKSVGWPGENSYSIGIASGVSSITVVEQMGQMGMVPWAKVIGHDRHTIALVNLALCELVELRSGG